MKKITYKKGSLFDVKEPDNVLAHACNCQGVWGSGIAVEFGRLFPDAFKRYKAHCDFYKKKTLGTATLYPKIPRTEEERAKPRIACLFTSYGYGTEKDSESKILKNSKAAIDHLLSIVRDGTHIHSPKINAGKFEVPWEKTASVIEECLKLRDVKWTVWELEQK